ncbi:MBL fold metallo-hydrolase [Burkholderia gladioli]|uniref:MBL fold metallo-hydrolase n=1 Tax=Burkholderia gladioli TaxID=28095 RepID=UPI001FC88445|nr:MBL fold metallo-hydrolase [Burkholderia gladioli]
MRLLTDPTFDPPGRYQEQPLRFEKTAGPALSVEEIGALDAVLLSHDRHSTISTMPAARAAGLHDAGRGAAAGRQCAWSRALRDAHAADARRPAPAGHGDAGAPRAGRHRAVFGRRDPLRARHRRAGDLVYVAGDTVWYQGTAEVARRCSPRMVVLFTGAAEPRGRFRMTMGSEDALEAAQAFPEARLVAVHNEGWVHLKETQAQLEDNFAKLGAGGRLTGLERGQP